MLRSPTTRASYNTYVERNARGIPNYGERMGYGEPISTAFVESTVNYVVSKRFAKRQQMQWTPRSAHLLLQVRTRVLNNDLGDAFKGWYPGLKIESEVEEKSDAAA